jgi:hypothetical protein
MPETEHLVDHPNAVGLAHPIENERVRQEILDEDDEDQEDLAAVALRLAVTRGVQVFCDELRNPCISLPDDNVQPVWPLYHQRVRAWFADLIQEEKQAFVTDRELLPALRVLEGRAWKVPRRPPAPDPTWQLIERDPVALALITFANQNGEYEGPTRDLFNRLHRPDIQDRLQIAALANKFPANTQVFSRRLNSVTHVLAAIGIDISLHHKEDGSYCVLRMRQPLFTREPDGLCVIPSASFSNAKTRPANTLTPADGTDAKPAINEENLNLVLGEIKAIRETQP